MADNPRIKPCPENRPIITKAIIINTQQSFQNFFTMIYA